jgi:hypothetical protein
MTGVHPDAPAQHHARSLKTPEQAKAAHKASKAVWLVVCVLTNAFQDGRQVCTLTRQLSIMNRT